MRDPHNLGVAARQGTLNDAFNGDVEVAHSPEEFAELDDCLSGVVALEGLLGSVLQ